MGKLKEIMEMMQSEDYKERFKAEYLELELRIGKLSDLLSKWKNGTLDFEPTCPYELLEKQLEAMKTYSNILLTRAGIEGIEL